MNEINTLVSKAAEELARKHAKIIEDNCKAVCNEYGCHPDQLILEFKSNTEINIRINALNFSINNIFTVNGNIINQ